MHRTSRASPLANARLSVLVASAFVVVVTAFAAAPAHAQYRNMGVQLPNVGVLNLGSWDWIINGGHSPEQRIGIGNPDPGWNLIDQPTVGLGFFAALGYDLWSDTQACVGAMTTNIDVGAQRTPVLTLQVSEGLRYNFLEERVRPFAAVHIEYMWLIGTGDATPVPRNSFLGNQPMYIGVRPGGGIEWIFGDEMSVQAEGDIIGFLVPDVHRGLGGLFLPASTLRLSFNVYF